MLFQYETERLYLRILNTENVDLVLDFFSRDRELFEKYETDRDDRFYTTEYMQKIMRYEFNAAMNQTTIRFYVFCKDQPNKIIGTVCLHDVSHGYYSSCEIGYKFSSAYHHKGYATEAIWAMLFIAFRELKLNRVNATVCRGNLPSCRLLEHMGFTNEGYLRDYLLLHGSWQDHYLYAYTASDYASSLQVQYPKNTSD